MQYLAISQLYLKSLALPGAKLCHFYLFIHFLKHLMLKYTNYMTTSCGEEGKKGNSGCP